MKVILLQDVKGTGVKDQILNVSDGFARNFLFPRKWAVEATDNAVREIERKNALAKKKEDERRALAVKTAAALKGKVVTVYAKCGEKGRLYGSVTGQEIADSLLSQHGVEIDKRKIELAEPIRTVGDTEASVYVYAGVKASIVVRVEARES